MYQEPLQPQPDQSEQLREWFASQPAPTPGPKKSRKKLFIILGVGLIGSGVLVTMLLFRPVAACLTAADYKDLTGTAYNDGTLSPKSDFATYLVHFEAGKASYDASSQPKGQQIIGDIAGFMSSRPNKPITLTLEASYSFDGGEELALERLSTLKSDLIKAGVSEESIYVQDPSLAEAEDTTEEVSTASIAMTSSATCSE